MLSRQKVKNNPVSRKQPSESFALLLIRWPQLQSALVKDYSSTCSRILYQKLPWWRHFVLLWYQFCGWKRWVETVVWKLRSNRALFDHFLSPQGVDLPDDFINLLESQLFRTLRIAAVSRWIGVGLGAVVALAALAMLIMQKQTVTITPSPNKDQRNNNRQ